MFSRFSKKKDCSRLIGPKIKCVVVAHYDLGISPMVQTSQFFRNTDMPSLFPFMATASLFFLYSRHFSLTFFFPTSLSSFVFQMVN
jgi:hypothetical protein